MRTRFLSSVAVLLAIAAGCSSQGGASGVSEAVNASAPSFPAAVLKARAGAAVGFEAAGDGTVRPVFDGPRGADPAISIELPVRASGTVRIADRASGARIEFTLEGASEAPVEVAGGAALYRAAGPSGADILHLAGASGTEDFLFFDAPPPREEIRYRVSVEGVAGLRLLHNTLEFLDASGTPRLRVSPPYFVDASGARRPATLAVEGCAFDADPRGPWGRPVTPPGDQACGVRVEWSAGKAAYPILVDPAWTTTGALVEARYGHTQTVLPSGKVLIAFGQQGSAGPYLATAELYDPVSATFSLTGALPASEARSFHAATPIEQGASAGQVLVAGGRNDAALASAWLYDPATGAFKATPALLSARYGHTATLMPPAGEQVLFAGGFGPSLPLAEATAEIYVPGAGSLGGSVDIGRRAFHTATLMPGGKVLLAGGMDSLSSATKTAATYQDGSVETLADMPVALAHHTATFGSELHFDEVLLMGGLVGSASAEVIFYHPVSGFGKLASKLKVARGYHTTTQLPSGRFLIAGGRGGLGGETTLSFWEVYDPGTDLIDGPGVVTTEERYSHAASLLTAGPHKGAVLVTGGVGETGIVLASAELFDERSDGVPCAEASHCDSGFCADGLCCESACVGKCKTCRAPLNGKGQDGVCGFVIEGENPNPVEDCLGVCVGDGFASQTCDGAGSCNGPVQQTPCPGAYTCSQANLACSTSCTGNADCSAATGYCEDGACVSRKNTGVACSLGVECASGYCVDGVCCNNACDGQCEACDVVSADPPVQKGTCAPVNGPPHGGRPACQGDGTLCSGTCDGVAVSACAFPDTKTQCGAATCAAGATAEGHCNGQGACEEEPCGARCQGSTLILEDGTAIACGHYTCDVDRCRDSCASIDDCAPPYVCNISGQCVPRPPQPLDEVGGCAAGGRAPGGSSRGWLAAFALSCLLAAAGRRRSFGRRSWL